jgi:F-type H+-transporting ATPase subunit b
MVGALPQLDYSTYSSQLFWLFVTFSILYISLSKYFIPNIANLIDRRKKYIINIEENVENENILIHELRTEQEKLIRDKNEEMSQIIKLANKKASDITAEGNEMINRNIKVLNDETTAELKVAIDSQMDSLRASSSKIVDLLSKKFGLNFNDTDLNAGIGGQFKELWYEKLEKLK